MIDQFDVIASEYSTLPDGDCCLLKYAKYYKEDYIQYKYWQETGAFAKTPEAIELEKNLTCSLIRREWPDNHEIPTKVMGGKEPPEFQVENLVNEVISTKMKDSPQEVLGELDKCPSRTRRGDIWDHLCNRNFQPLKLKRIQNT